MSSRAESARRRLALLLAVGAVGAACGPGRADPPFRHIVLVTIDTLRADHLGAYGYPRATSPRFDALAAQGVLFERAYAPISTTVPSHASIFTSLYPIQHRVLRNGLILHPRFETLAERLSRAGFETAGFVAVGSMLLESGIDQGFATFDAPQRRGAVPYRRADETVAAALAWLEQSDALAKPLFLFVHLFDPHRPMVPPTPYVQPFEPPGHPARERFLDFLLSERGVSIGVVPGGRQGLLNHYREYDGEVRFADAELGRLLGELAERSQEPVLFVVTADHGQGLGSHGYFAHGRNLYEEQLRVPLLFVASDGRFPPRRVQILVEHVDLLPTLLELAGVGLEAPPPPHPPPVGRSFAALLYGEAPAFPEREAFAQRRIYSPLRPLRPPEYEPGDKYALTGRRWKYIQRSIGASELYDLSEDPGETRNLAEARPELRAELAARLRARLEELEPTRAPEAIEIVDPDTREELEALGYLN